MNVLTKRSHHAPRLLRGVASMLWSCYAWLSFAFNHTTLTVREYQSHPNANLLRLSHPSLRSPSGGAPTLTQKCLHADEVSSTASISGPLPAVSVGTHAHRLVYSREARKKVPNGRTRLESPSTR